MLLTHRVKGLLCMYVYRYQVVWCSTYLIWSMVILPIMLQNPLFQKSLTYFFWEYGVCITLHPHSLSPFSGYYLYLLHMSFRLLHTRFIHKNPWCLVLFHFLLNFRYKYTKILFMYLQRQSLVSIYLIQKMSAFFQQCGFGDYRKAWIYTMGYTSKQLMKGLKIENVICMAI